MNTINSNNVCPRCQSPIPADAPQALCPQCVFAGAAEAASTATKPGNPEIPSLESVARAFPHLEIVGLIGHGGMGSVFKARQPHLDRFVALKLLPDKLAQDPQFTERFNREGRVLARLNHPNIVAVFDFGRTEHFYYLTMEYVDGVNLRQAMAAGRFSPAEALGVVPKICEALQYAHEQGVLHRDIKPENILLDTKGRVKIADFGIAKLVEDEPGGVTLTGTGAALGTPHYMAPEQLEKPSDVDHRADIYSLGVVFYEMLTGELPIGRFAPPSAKTPVHTTVDDVVFRTLEKDREKRFQSAGDMKTHVEHLSEITPPDRSDEGESSTEEKPSYFRATIGALLVGASLVKPLGVAMSLLAGKTGVSPSDLWLAASSVALPGLGGTFIGWLALNEIREGNGAVRALPLALFAMLTWPLLALLAATLGPTMYLMSQGGGSFMARLLMVVLPAAVLSFAVWILQSLSKWATTKPATPGRGPVSWAFAVVIICAYAVAFIYHSNHADTAAKTEPEVLATTEPQNSTTQDAQPPTALDRISVDGALPEGVYSVTPR